MSTGVFTFQLNEKQTSIMCHALAYLIDDLVNDEVIRNDFVRMHINVEDVAEVSEYREDRLEW